jgi:hypothetical protein
VSVCRACGRPIRWLDTVRGKSIPIDPGPLPDGRVIILANGRARVLDADDVKKYPGPVFRSHFASCEALASHRDAAAKATAAVDDGS